MSNAAETAKKDDEKDAKTVTVYANGTAHIVEKKDELTFEEVVAFAYPNTPPGGYSVMYERAHGNADGTLVAGQSVKVKDGIRFHVTATDRS